MAKNTKQKLLMKAPPGATNSSIKGHRYEIPKSGIIEVISPLHVDALKRHGFTDHAEEPEDLSNQIDEMDDKDELVEFIEERGGEADNSMGLKKLRRLARAAAGIEE